MEETSVPKEIEGQLNLAQRELNVLYDISSAMRSTLELDHILYIILTGVTSHMGLGYNRAILYMVNPKNRSLECQMVIGPDSGEHAERIWQYINNAKQDLDDLIQVDKATHTISQSSLYQSLKDLKFPIYPENASLLTCAFHQGQPWHIAPDNVGEYSGDPLLKVFKTTELIIMPLKAKDKVKGLIIADNLFTKKPITQTDIKFFTMLANQAGLAIENSQLYEMVVQKSHTDPVTNLWNHGFFQEKLSEALAFSQKNKIPLALLIIDIDNFKAFNDTYGHQYGDEVLREMASLLRQDSRDLDYVCRYGGEEFVVILSQTSKDQSMDVAERLRKKIDNHLFVVGGQMLHITISVGVASYPEHATTKEDLIAKADKAMYRAKSGGKNRTCMASAAD